MSARDRITELYPDPEPGKLDLAALTRESQDVLLEQLRDRFERVVDAFVQYRLGSNDQRSALLGVLFEFYDEGHLTKAEVRQRGQIEPEDFYDELRAHRLRRSGR
jgi:hypothetical protein